MSSLPGIKPTFAPPYHVKVKEQLSLDRRLLSDRNIILSRNPDKVNRDSLILVGKVLEHMPQPDYYGFNVWLDVSYPHVILVAGRRGTGKSYTLGVVAEGLGLERNQTLATTKPAGHAALVIDTLGQFWQMRYPPQQRDAEEKAQLKQLHDWGLSPLSLEKVQVFVPKGRKISSDWKELTLKFSEVEASELAGLLNVDLYQDRMGQLLYHVFAKVRDEGYESVTVDEYSGKITTSKSIPPNKDFQTDDLIHCLDSDREVISPTSGFELQTRRALRNRLSELGRWRIFSREGIAIDEIFKRDCVTVLNLEGIDQDLRNLTVAVIVRKIFQERELTRRQEKLDEVHQKTEKRSQLPPGWLLIDEGHEFCPNVGNTASKQILIKFAKEGRSLGLGLVLATQQPSALSEKISSQVELVICHALAFISDINSLTDRLVNRSVDRYELTSEELDFEQQIRLLPPGVALVSSMGVPRTFLMVVRPRLTLHGGKAPPMS